MRALTLTLLLVGLLGGCRSRPAPVPDPVAPAVTPKAPPSEVRVEPDRITVDHILIPVRNPDTPPIRVLPDALEEDAARKLADELLARLRGGADWATLKREHSADPPPGGPYRLANHGVTPADKSEHGRSMMVPAFGDVGFALEVAEMGMAVYDAKASPFGFHIMRRVE